MAHTPAKVLFVDDDLQFLEMMQRLMGEYAGSAWTIFTAPDTAKALSLLNSEKIDLLVIDLHMPIVDGLQFLKLLQRKYRNLLKVVLTGDTSGEFRAACLGNGAELYLEKPRQEGGWQTVYANLNEMVRIRPEEGFRGVLRRVGLADVLQLECLARNSSVLEVSGRTGQGEVYIHEGQIIHAQAGDRTGENAFNLLMAQTGGEFSVKPFTPPSQQTIQGSWEFLLMEAARKRDEAAGLQPEETAPVQTEETPPPEESLTFPSISVFDPGMVGLEPFRPVVEEMLICSPQGDVLYEWKCKNTNPRINFLEFLSQKSRQIGQGLPLGHFDRLELSSAAGRVIARVHAHHALFVRTSRAALSQNSTERHEEKR